MAEEPTTDDLTAMLDLSKKKKKKKKKKEKTEVESNAPGAAGDGEDLLSPVPVEEFDELDKRANYDYDELLDRVVKVSEGREERSDDRMPIYTTQ